MQLLTIAGGVCAVILFLAGLFSGIRRICVYSLVMLALLILGHLKLYSMSGDVDLIREALGLYIIIFGAFIFISGIVFLIKFLADFPPGKESPDGG